MKYPILREWYFNEVFLGQTIELVDKRITSDSSKMKQFQLLEIIDVLRTKAKARAKEQGIDLEDVATKALLEVYGKKNYRKMKMQKL